jgi:hypothetical protein
VETTRERSVRSWDQDRSDRTERLGPTDRMGRADRTDRPDWTGRTDRMGRSYREDSWRTDDQEGSFRGSIVAVNPEARTMSVEAPTGEVRHFEFGDRPNLQLFHTRYPRLIDLRVGFPVRVGFRVEQDGTHVAHTVIRTDRPEVR